MDELVPALPLGTDVEVPTSFERGSTKVITGPRSIPSFPPPPKPERPRRVGPGARFGRYVLDRRLAIGGMGEVFVATQYGMGEFQKPIALKLLLPHLAAEPKAVETFLDEARLVARMSHPNVVQIIDVGNAEDRYYIAMELVPGISVAGLIQGLTKAHEQISAQALIYIARFLCDGLHHAHQLRGDDGQLLGVVHRDVTPHNVLLSTRGEVKLGDFGIAKFRSCACDTWGVSIKGKLAYLAPEQLTGREPDRRADLYSAALTLFHLATLQSPSQADEFNPPERSETWVLQELEKARPDLPRELIEAIGQAAHKDPEQRFPNARAFREALPTVTLESADELARLVRAMADEQGMLDDEGGTLAGSHPGLSKPPPVSARREAAKHLLHKARVRARSHLKRASRWCAESALLRRVRAHVRSTFERLLDRYGETPLARQARAHARSAITGAARWYTRAELPRRARTGARRGVAVARRHMTVDLLRKAVLAVIAGATTAALVLGVASLGRQLLRKSASPAAIRLGADSPDAAAQADVLPAALIVPATESPRPAPANRTGYLTIDALPWGEVTIDGQPVGQTPVHAYPAGTGTVLVTLRSPVTGKTERRDVRLVPGKLVHVQVNLR